jgi:hypothetical protein
MTVVASSIINRVRLQLVDTGTPQRWSDAELLDWLSDGQRSIVAALPGAAPVKVTQAMVAGVLQPLPAVAYKLITIFRNLTTGGVAGQSCQEIDRSLMDMQYSSWPSDAPASNVRVWWYDEDDPGNFYIYPPNDGTGSVELTYSVMPLDLTATTSNLVLRDIYQTALFDYVMARAHQKDSDYAAGGGLVTAYMQLFTSFIETQRGAK